MKEWLICEKSLYSQHQGFFGGICLSEQDYIWKYRKRLRLTEYYLNTGKRIRYLLSRTVLVRQRIRCGLNIRINSCGKGLHILHISSVITNGDIGRNFTVFPNVLIGAGRGGEPIIKDNVTVYTGATVIGKIVLECGITVGANALVNKSCEQSNVVLGGVPAKGIYQKK